MSHEVALLVFSHRSQVATDAKHEEVQQLTAMKAKDQETEVRLPNRLKTMQNGSKEAKE